MKHLFKVIFFTIVSLLVIISLFCSGNPFEDGQKAFDNKDYSLALKYFTEAKKEQPENQAIHEKIALCYMMRGKDIFEKNKNIQSFYGNFNRGEEFVPGDPSPEFQKLYSGLLFTLADAYINTTPENNVQKEEYLNKSISFLESSLVFDANNTDAENLLNKIKSDNFASILEKGKGLFNQAKKQGNNDLYFAAEYYFIKANNFNPENKEARDFLSKTRAKTLDVPDIKQDIAIAVGDQSYSKGSYLIYIEVHNNTQESIDIKQNKFKLVDKSGKEYSFDSTLIAKLKKETVLPEQSLKGLKSIGGIIAFKMNKKAKVAYLEYNLSKEKSVKKYFP